MGSFLDGTGLSGLLENIQDTFQEKINDLDDIREGAEKGANSLPDDTKYAASASVGGVANKTAGIPFGVVDSTSTSTVFTATVDGITELRDGVCVLLKNGVVTSAAGYTININGLGAKPTFNNMTAATRDTTIFNKDYTMLFIYDSTRVVDGITGAWCGYRGYDANTNTLGYQLRTNSYSLTTLDAFRYYKILFTSADGNHWVPASADSANSDTSAKVVNQRPINPFGEIVYCGDSTAYSANGTPSATALWQQYTLTLGYSFNRTGAALTLTAKKPVYVKCTPQLDSSAIIDADTPYVQDLPTTDDGKIYILLGIAYSATNIELTMKHPVYCYKNGSIQQWCGVDSGSIYTTNESFAKETTSRSMSGDIMRVGGNSVVWNQLVQNGDFSDGLTGWSAYRVSVTDAGGEIVIQPTTAEYGANNLNQEFASISGHKYFIGFEYKSTNSCTIYCASSTANSLSAESAFTKKQYIVTSTGYEYIRIYPSIGSSYSQDDTMTLRGGIICVDLTLMFGAGNEPATAEEFEKWINKHVGDSEYYAYNTGELLSVQSTKFKTQGDRWEYEKQIPITTITGKLDGEGESVVVFPDGMRSAGTAKDEIVQEGGVTKAIKRIGAVDLGTLNWFYQNGSFRARLTDLKVAPNNATIVGLLCAKYKAVIPSAVAATDGSISSNNGVQQVMIHDSHYVIADFKTAMSGVMLYYELAEPQEYILDNFELPIQMKVEEGGTRTMYPTNGEQPTSLSPYMDIKWNAWDSSNATAHDSRLRILDFSWTDLASLSDSTKAKLDALRTTFKEDEVLLMPFNPSSGESTLISATCFQPTGLNVWSISAVYGFTLVSVIWNNGTYTSTIEDISTQLAAKQDVLTFDTTPTAGSTNPVTSEGIKTYVDTHTPTITMDDAPSASSSNPVKSSGIYSALQSKQNSADIATINGSDITHGGNVSIVAAEGQTITIDAVPTAGSANAVSSGGTYGAIEPLNTMIFDGYVDLTRVEDGCILNTGVYSPDGKHIFVPVHKGNTITFVSSSAAVGVYAEVESQNMDIAPVFIIPRTAIPSNQSVVINILQDGYFYIHIKTPNISFDYTPTSVYIKSVFSQVQEKADNIPAYDEILFAGSSSIQRMFNQTGNFSLSTLFDGYTLVNYGVGGEDIRAIGARMASEGLVVATDFTIPASGGVSGMTFSVRGQAVSFTAQRGESLPALNPICIAGIWGNLSMSGGTYTFTRLANGASTSVKAGEIVVPYSVVYRKVTTIAALGYNGGYTDADDYVSYHDNIVRHLYDNRYIFIGILVANGQWDNPTSEQLDIETKMLYRFGANYFNIRQWLSRYGIAYGIGMGLLDSSTYPTSQDITDMNAGVVPHSLRSDSAHLTDVAYKIVNKKIRELVELLDM